MAEDFRGWGILSEAEKYFLESLELNPLDYQTYTGLAKTYLALNKFEEAGIMLDRGFSHALNNMQKSHISRLSGRTFFAEGNFEGSVESLKQRIDLSPGYTSGHYDYARYRALTRRKEECLDSLKLTFAIAPFFAGLAANEPRMLRGLVNDLAFTPVDKLSFDSDVPVFTTNISQASTLRRLYNSVPVVGRRYRRPQIFCHVFEAEFL